MRMGTKSLLYGAHQFMIHPWFVAWGWWKLYGFPWDPRLWVCFVVHDWGYWGMPNMDGKEGERHPVLGAKIVSFLFDRGPAYGDPFKWWSMCLLHSRYWAVIQGEAPSKLCYADKMAFALTPKWIYLPLVWMTGEWREYAAAHDKEVGAGKDSMVEWYRKSVEYTNKWVWQTLANGGQDTMTKGHD